MKAIRQTKLYSDFASYSKQKDVERKTAGYGRHGGQDNDAGREASTKETRSAVAAVRTSRISPATSSSTSWTLVS